MGKTKHFFLLAWLLTTLLSNVSVTVDMKKAYSLCSKNKQTKMEEIV